MAEFKEEIFTDEWEVETPEGWKSFDGIGETIPYQVYIVTFENGTKIKCADTHIFIDKHDNEIFTKDLEIGRTRIQSKEGFLLVTGVQETDESHVMYDLLNVDGSLYYTDDITSHNSTLFRIYAMWYALFNEYKQIAILSKTEKASKQMIRLIKMSYQHLPIWMQVEVETWNKTSMALSNGTVVYGAATSSSSIRGDSANILIIDEVAFIPTNVWEEFYQSSYPVISSSKTSRVFLISTPCGLNHFYKIYTDGEKKLNDYHTLKVTWDQVPGRDENWKANEIRQLGLQGFNQEFNVEFIGSGNTLIESDVLKALSYQEPESYSLLENTKYEQYCHLYVEPQEDHVYMIGVDCAKITEDSTGDNLFINIIDITELPFEQVYTVSIRSGVHYLEIPSLLNELGTLYNDAFVFVENNDSAGQEIGDMLLYEEEYENVFFEKKDISGFRTTTKTKKAGCLNLKLLLEHYQLIIHDFDTVAQLSTFVKKRNTFKAESKYFDDAVMSLIASLFYMQCDDEFGKTFIENKTEFIQKVLKGKIQENQIRKMKKLEEENEPMSVGFFGDVLDGLGESVF